MKLNLIAYGYHRSEEDFAGHDIMPGKFFIDDKTTEREELRAAVAFARQGVGVVVLKLSDFGRGGLAAKVRKAFEDAGATVIVAEEEKRPRGRPEKRADLEPDMEAKARDMFLNGLQKRDDLVRRINRVTGLDWTYDQYYYYFVRKPAAEAKRK